ncbi:hypothetical protein N7528_006871 [Penicillium herquei]|nr:hypothetical protein N7528_006871 [Penicillium herquei]
MTPDAETKLACLVCRHRKVACDRQRPKCGLCEKNKFDCQYRAREHKPGLRAGYVSQLEKRVEHLEQRMEEIVGQLSRQQSRNIDSLPDFNELTSGVSFDLQNTQSLEYGTAEHMSSAPPDDSQVYRNTSCSAPPSIQTNESLHYELQALWLQNYHPWFPILHHTSVKAAFSVGPKVQRLVQKAIMAVTIRDTRALSAEQKVSQSRKMDEEVTIEALSSSSLDSVQALLILSILAWGEGNWSQFAGVARFKSLRLSVRDSDVPMTNLTIDREERIRAFWMMEMLDSIFAMVSASNYSAPSVPLAANFPCSDTAWALEDPFREGVSFHDLRYSSGFSMCISLCTNELGAVHRFQETVREACDIAGGLEWQSSAQSLDESLTIRREEFVAAVFRLINAEFSQNHRAEMEPFIVLTNCFLNMSVPCIAPGY